MFAFVHSKCSSLRQDRFSCLAKSFVGMLRVFVAGVTVAGVVMVGIAESRADQILDQEQLLYNGGTSARTLPGYTVWQSITAGITGSLSQIDMGFFNDMSGDGMLRIYSGEGTTGSLLQELAVPVVGITQQEVTWNSWAVNVSIEQGSQYTFELTPNPMTLPDPYGVAIGTPNPYANGVFGLNDPSGSYTTNFDAVFRTYVNSIPEPSFPAIMLGLFHCLMPRRRR